MSKCHESVQILSSLYMISTMDVNEVTHLSSRIVYVAITLIMLFGVQHMQSEKSSSEVRNAKDRYAISVLQGSDVLGHLPQKISRFFTSSSWNIM